MTTDAELDAWDAIFESAGIDEMVSRFKLNTEQLSDYLVYRAWGGGTGWPSELVRRGANPSQRDDEGATALSRCLHAASPYTAARASKIETLETAIELLVLGADPNQLYSTSCSATSLALTLNKPDFVALLLLAGADLNKVEPDDGRTLRAILATSERPWARQLLKLADR